MADPLALVAPGADAIVRAALERVKPGSRVLVLGAQGHVTPLFENVAGKGNVHDESSGDAIDEVDAFDLILLFTPSRLGPLIGVLTDFHESLAPDGRLVVGDLAWQTAPSPQLAQAFAPPPGREKVRPVEGYEMQLEHAGFEVEERLAFGQGAWLDHLSHHPAAVPQRQAIEADERGAAAYAVWVLRKAD